MLYVIFMVLLAVVLSPEGRIREIDPNLSHNLNTQVLNMYGRPRGSHRHIYTVTSFSWLCHDRV